MSWENEDNSLSPRSLVGSIAPDSDHQNWKPRIVYSKDFLLALSESDVCKKLPTDLDKSVLSDLEQAAITVSERQRSVGNLAFQGPRRGDHGFQSLNRLENSNSYARGNSTRWDTRSSGSNDREGDLQFDRESFTQDSGKRFGNQNQRTRLHQEHDGLLGSGALARPSGYAGTLISKVRCNDPLQLSKSTEAYQPPRPCKAAPYSRKDVTDSCNDETFGTSDCSDKDKTEERKRRESFELMRKEQQKALQEKQHKSIVKGNHAVDIMELLDSSNTDKSTKTRSKPDDSVTDSLPLSDSSKSFSHTHVPAARPLVPPGFANTLLEKNQQINKLNNPDLQIINENENLSAALSADVDFSNSSFSSSGLREVNEVCEENILNDHFHKEVAGPDRVDAVTQDHPTSIFDKLFGSAEVKNSECLGSDIQNHASKDDEEEAWTHEVSASSKFVHLFYEENEGQPIETKLIRDKSSRDLLSLFVNNDSFASEGYMPSNNDATELNQPMLPSKNNVFLSSSTHSSVSGMPLESHQGAKQSHSCAVLTCEDLEQAILAEAKERCSVEQSFLAEDKDICSVKQSMKQEPWTAVDIMSEEHNVVVDDHASQHLLSLLQRAANAKESAEFPRLDAIGNPEILHSSDIESNLRVQFIDNSSHNLSETERRPEKCLTLESLFGSAFMNELHSMEAPVSAQKTSVGRVTDIGANQLPATLDNLASSSSEHFLKKNVFDGEISQLNNAVERMNPHKNAGNWADYSPLLHNFKVGDLAFEQTAQDILLPEEDSLISLNDSLDMATSTRLQESLGPKKTVVGDLSDKLNAILRVGDSSRESALDYISLGRAPHEMVDSDSHHYQHHLHARVAPQFPQQMNHGRPPFFPSHLDHSTFRNTQINFGSPDAMHLDPYHPFSSNAFAHHSYNNFSGQQLDPAVHHGMLQALQFSGNFPSHNTVQHLPHVPFSQPMNHALDFSYDVNSRHAPLRHRQVNYGSLGMGIPGPVGNAGRPPPEIYERLIEMEMRANSKFHPAIPDHVPGFYGAEFESNSRYR